jgi:electron transport complex protein RnfG
LAAPQAGPLRMMVTLGIAGLCSGLAIVGIFLVTQPMIERNRAAALEAAIYRVLEGARTRVAFVLREGKLARFESPDESLPKEEAVYAGYDEAGTLVGFAVPAEGAGFQDTIKLLYGYSVARRRVVGMEVLESRETPGLGDKIIKDEEFVGNFRDLAVAPEIVAVKSGRTKDNEVDAISGATISSNAVVRIINESNARWLERLAEAGRSVAAGNGSHDAGQSPERAESGGTD